MIRTLICACFITLFSAQHRLDSTDEDQQILFYTYNLNYQKAEALIHKKIKESPDHPKYYFFLSALMFQKLTNEIDFSKRDSIGKIMALYAEKSIKIAEKKLLSTEIKFYLGAAYGYIGRYNVIDKSWLKAYNNGRKGKNYLEEVIEEDPKFYDAYLGLGIFNYMASRLPAAAKFLAWIVGMSGDPEKGIEYLKIAREKGRLSHAEANQFLFSIYNYMEKDLDLAKVYIEDFLNYYPNNTIMNSAYIGLLTENYDFKQADSAILKFLNNKTPWLIYYKPYIWASYYSRLGKVDSAFYYSQQVLRNQMNSNYNYPRWVLKNVKSIHLQSQWYMQADNLTFLDSLDETRFSKDYLDVFKEKVSHDEISIALEFQQKVVLQNDESLINSLYQRAQRIKNNFLKKQIEFFMALYYYKRSQFHLAEDGFWKSSEQDILKFESYYRLYNIYTKNKNTVDKQSIRRLINALKKYDNYILNFKIDSLEALAKKN